MYCTGEGQCVSGAKTEPPLQTDDGAGNPIDVPLLPEGDTAPVGARRGSIHGFGAGVGGIQCSIDVPPGRGGDGAARLAALRRGAVQRRAGIGWKLEGLSQITRCPKINALDGYSAPVKNDTTDRFCLDGKRLETISASATYGGDGVQYRPPVIDSFGQVTSRVDTGAGGF